MRISACENPCEKICQVILTTSECLDIKDCADNEKGVEDLITCMRNLGFTEFTFSSTWSGAVETAWLFQKAGCILAGLVEIDGPKNFEKAHGYLFRVN